MDLFGFVERYARHKRARQLVDLVAGRSHSAVWDRVERQVVTMQLAEARGYIRARAAEVIHDHVDAEHRRRPLSPLLRKDQLISHATDRVVSLIFRDLLNLSSQQGIVRRAAA